MNKFLLKAVLRDRKHVMNSQMTSYNISKYTIGFKSCLSPARKGSNVWTTIQRFYFYFTNLLLRCHFPNGILDQVWCLIVSIPDLYPLSYFYAINYSFVCMSSYRKDRMSEELVYLYI